MLPVTTNTSRKRDVVVAINADFVTTCLRRRPNRVGVPAHLHHPEVTEASRLEKVKEDLKAGNVAEVVTEAVRAHQDWLNGLLKAKVKLLLLHKLRQQLRKLKLHPCAVNLDELNSGGAKLF